MGIGREAVMNKRRLLAAIVVLTATVGFAGMALQGCKCKVPTAMAYYQVVITPTPSSVTPVICSELFNGCETLTENGTWSGSSATRTLSTSHVTQGLYSMQANVTVPAAYNQNMMNLNGFTPSVWSNVKKLTFDVYVDSSLTVGAGYSQMVLIGTSPSIGKNWSLLAPGAPISSGSNSVTFTIDFSLGAHLPTDAFENIMIIYNNSATNPVGSFYVDNMKLWTCN